MCVALGGACLTSVVERVQLAPGDDGIWDGHFEARNR